MFVRTFPNSLPNPGQERETGSRFDKQGSSQKEIMGTFSIFKQTLIQSMVESDQGIRNESS